MSFEKLEERTLLAVTGISLAGGDFNDSTLNLISEVSGISAASEELEVLQFSKVSTESEIAGNEITCKLGDLPDLPTDGEVLFDNEISKSEELYTVSEDAVSVFLSAEASESETITSISTTLTALTETETFALHSLEGSNYTIYLDFTGHITSGTQWNASYNSGADIITPAFDLDGDTATFNETELAAIYEIWQRVSEDYLPFNVDVTTEEPSLDKLMRSENDSIYGVRICIGGSSYDWYSNPQSSAAGGIAYDRSFTSTMDLPCFVFTKSLQNVTKYIAESAAHEAGHTLCLSHDGQGSTAYYQGTSNWAPIMGTGYYSELTQWSKGDYSNSNNTEDDLQILANMLGTRSDDYADDFENAHDLGALSNSTSVSGIIGLNWKNISGMLELVSDVDTFSFSTEPTNAILRIAGLCGITNLNVKVSLYDSEGTLQKTYNPNSDLYVLVDLSHLNGSYYLTVEGAGCADAGTEETGYGSLGAYTLSFVYGLPDLYFTKTGSMASEVFFSSDSSGKISQTVFSNDSPVYLFLALTNSGTENIDAGAYKVYFYYNDKVVTAISDVSMTYGTVVKKGYYVYNPSNSSQCSISSTGVYLFKAVIVYENYEISKSNNSVSITFEIHDPWTTTVSLAAVELGTNSPNHSPAGTLTAVDPWCKDFTFSLVDDNAGGLSNSNFSISGNLLILESTLAKGSYTICVRSTSSSGYSVLNRLTITILETAKIAPTALLTVSSWYPQEETVLILSSTGSCDSEKGTDLTRQWRIYNSAGNLQKTILTQNESIAVLARDYAEAGEDFHVELTVFDKNNMASLPQTTVISVQDSLPEFQFQIIEFDGINLIKLNLNISTFFKKNYSSLTINWGDETVSYDINSFYLSLIHYYSTNGNNQISLTTNNGGYNFYLGFYSAQYVKTPSVSSSVSYSESNNLSVFSDDENANKSRRDNNASIFESQGLTDSQLRLLAIHLLESSSSQHKKQSRGSGNTF